MNKISIKKPLNFSRVTYGAFTLLGLCFCFLLNDKSTGVIQFGIALVFDPFDQTVTWAKRPLYQRAWLVGHLIIELALFTWMIFLS
jgi:hypothetical protein